VDAIMVPGQVCDAITFHQMANSSLQLQVRQPAGADPLHAQARYAAANASLLECNLVAYFGFKDIPVPKLWVPVGLDDAGSPVSLGFMGRAPNVDDIYSDEVARTHDLRFLYAVRRMVAAFAATPGLARANADAVTANLFEPEDGDGQGEGRADL
jgi:hypothetical protein